MTKEYPDADGLTTVEWLEFFLEHVPEMQIQHVMTLLRSLRNESLGRIRSDGALAVLWHRIEPVVGDGAGVHRAAGHAAKMRALFDDKGMDELYRDWGKHHG